MLIGVSQPNDTALVTAAGYLDGAVAGSSIGKGDVNGTGGLGSVGAAGGVDTTHGRGHAVTVRVDDNVQAISRSVLVACPAAATHGRITGQVIVTGSGGNGRHGFPYMQGAVTDIIGVAQLAAAYASYTTHIQLTHIAICYTEVGSVVDHGSGIALSGGMEVSSLVSGDSVAGNNTGRIDSNACTGGQLAQLDCGAGIGCRTIVIPHAYG